MTNPELEWSFCSKGSKCFAGELSVQNSPPNPTLGTDPRPVLLQWGDHQVIPCLVWLHRNPSRSLLINPAFFGGVQPPTWSFLPNTWESVPKPVLSGDSWTCTGRREIPSNLEIPIPSSSQQNHGWGTAPRPKPCPWLVIPGCIWIYLMHGDICLSYVARLLSNFFPHPRARLKIPINGTRWKVL